MKNNYQRIIGFLAILALLGLASAAGAESRRGSFENRKEARIKAIHERLNLSTEQGVLLEEHRAKHRQEALELRKKARTAKEALRDELQRPELDMKRINEFHARLKDVYGRRADHRLEGVLEVRKILTPEQFSLFMELMEKHRPWKGKRHGGPERALK